MLPIIASALSSLGGAALGGLKHQLLDKPKEQQQRRVAAETIKYSPWTGMQAPGIQEASLGNSLLQGASLGAKASDKFKLGSQATPYTPEEAQLASGIEAAGNGEVEGLPTAQVEAINKLQAQKFKQNNVVPASNAWMSMRA